MYWVSFFAADPKRAKLFHDKSLADEDIYEPFLRLVSYSIIVLGEGQIFCMLPDASGWPYRFHYVNHNQLDMEYW